MSWLRFGCVQSHGTKNGMTRARLGVTRRRSASSPKQSFAGAESGHSNSVKLTFADEAGGTPRRSPKLTTGGAARR